MVVDTYIDISTIRLVGIYSMFKFDSFVRNDHVRVVLISFKSASYSVLQ